MAKPDAPEPMRFGIVVLAAGLSTRFVAEGIPAKQLYEFEGESLVRRACRAALTSRAERAVAVVGHEAERTSAELQRSPSIEIEIVYNPGFAHGQASSVRCGLAALTESGEPTLDGVMFLPCDQPRIDSKTIDFFFDVFEQSAKRGSEPAIVVPRASDRPSSPVTFPADLFDELRTLEGDQGGRQLLQKHSSRVIAAVIEDLAVLQDIDSLADVPDRGSLS